MQNKKNSIVLICDDNFVIPTGVAISSIISSKNIDTYYDIYIVCASLSEESEAIFSNFNSDTVTIHIVREDANKFADLHDNYSYSSCAAPPVALLKFALPDIFVDHDKILYLDGDILVRTDLSELYETELGNNLLAAVRNISLSGNKVYKCVPDYFNSGVMLLNLAQMRLENTKEALIKAKIGCEVTFLMDQQTYNYVCTGRVKLLPIRYNLLAVLYDLYRDKWSAELINQYYGTNYNNQEEIFEDAVIIHFASKDKPWKNPNVIFADEWLNVYCSTQALHQDSNFCMDMLISYSKKACKSSANMKTTENKLRYTEQKLVTTEKKLNASLSRENSLKKSMSFQLGRIITWGPRKIRGGIRCYNQHGAVYTLRRTVWHIMHLK